MADRSVPPVSTILLPCFRLLMISLQRMMMTTTSTPITTPQTPLSGTSSSALIAQKKLMSLRRELMDFEEYAATTDQQEPGQVTLVIFKFDS